jgi:hypothetical protein
MFRGVGRRRARRELHALADAGVEVFLAAYRSPRKERAPASSERARRGIG